ncbi:LLM class F420-dependent oxidoreductase [Frankia sp. AgB1.9]|uniref:LLM class F420-dependent oxidoreductase n=1 Tax=unclassified Frankia TaxID=2632575 RepID=UPI001931F89A|nr:MULTISPECIES: LLM class F420-dependent oxidoreductase [unclassified Frankia]MBL7491969.1 LLM class F420-dependent oxidoreductase [Frankia sp. AgW1.1]MBL7548392.1 LLM class F420-dependent oxidoreductase [Frankia sp. AgB1.9]MBL7619100.1 LLM class F420-dependent oxidoreductase [Frankia sp. AgB1.8]
MRYFFHYPETSGVDGDMFEPGPVDEVAAAAERAGFEGFALTDHPIPGANWLTSGGHQSLDPFVGLAFAAAATERLRLLTHLSVAPYRNPFVLAKAAATVDKLSGGRFILGLGVGYQKSEFFALGVDMEERNLLFDEALDVLPLHWSGEAFTYRGRHFDARNVIARPRPVQNPIPIWIGGNSKLSRRRVAERAQGWMPMSGPPQLSTTARTVAISSVEQLGKMIQEVRAAAEEHGRTEPLDFLYSYSEIEDPAREPERHREAIAEIEKAGVNRLMITCFTRETAATLDFIESFGAVHIS